MRAALVEYVDSIDEDATVVDVVCYFCEHPSYTDACGMKKMRRYQDERIRRRAESRSATEPYCLLSRRPSNSFLELSYDEKRTAIYRRLSFWLEGESVETIDRELTVLRDGLLRARKPEWTQT